MSYTTLPTVCRSCGKPLKSLIDPCCQIATVPPPFDPSRVVTVAELERMIFVAAPVSEETQCNTTGHSHSHTHVPRDVILTDGVPAKGTCYCGRVEWEYDGRAIIFCGCLTTVTKPLTSGADAEP